MRTKREEKFHAAITLIQNMLRQELVMQGWDKKERVDQIMIDGYHFGPTYAARTNDDEPAGYAMNISMEIHIIEPEDLTNRRRLVALKEYETALNKAAESNKTLEEAKKKLGFFDKAIVCGPCQKEGHVQIEGHCTTCFEEPEMIPCGTFGCQEPKKKDAIFCPSCKQDYLEDPDAYK